MALRGETSVSGTFATWLLNALVVGIRRHHKLTIPIDQVFCLPVPEKAKRQHNFIILPVHGDGVNPIPDHLKTTPPDPIVWTFEEATGKNIVEGEDPGPGPLAEAIHHCLIQVGTGKTVIFPEEEEFESAIPQSHRKGEKAYHVKGHRGSKEGACSLSIKTPITETLTNSRIPLLHIGGHTMGLQEASRVL